MKVVTESYLRSRFRTSVPESFCLGAGQVLTPSAAQYLGEQQVAVVRAGEPEAPPARKKAGMPEAAHAVETDSGTTPGHSPRAAYRSARDGGAFEKKPEHMTQLHGRLLVSKDHPRIGFRGKLDSLQSLTLLLRHEAGREGRTALAGDLGELLDRERQILKAEVLDQPLETASLFGLTDSELRDRSHHPGRFFKTGHILPDADMDRMLLELNRLRTEVRETELLAVHAFRGESGVEKIDIVQALNRMSSAVYIMMLKFSAGGYS